ncbi:hypothetical protein ACJX0J_027378, partial [Zea mays]
LKRVEILEDIDVLLFDFWSPTMDFQGSMIIIDHIASCEAYNDFHPTREIGLVAPLSVPIVPLNIYPPSNSIEVNGQDFSTFLVVGDYSLLLDLLSSWGVVVMSQDLLWLASSLGAF